MSAEKRRYRLRFATVGSEELTDDTTAFTLDVSDMATVPVVAGSIAHPIQGSTEMRPFWVPCVDKDGGLITSFTREHSVPDVEGFLGRTTITNRWGIVGRLVDVQWQLTSDDAESDPWTTYGTGRCSGFNEADGPGRFNVEISDESWKARKNRAVFEGADTTQIWPAGVRPGLMDRELPVRRAWREIEKCPVGWGEVVQRDGNLHRLRLQAFTVFTSPPNPIADADPNITRRTNASMGLVTGRMKEWIKDDALSGDDLAFDTSSFPTGNFRHLRLRWGQSQHLAGAIDNDYEIVSFGGLDEESMFRGLDEVQWRSTSQAIITELHVWVRSAGPVSSGPLWPESSASTGVDPRAFLYAPTAPPSDALPLHIGVNNADHDWGTEGGYIHVADLHRRVWDRMGLRYDSDNLDEFEADTSFPALAPWVGDGAENPEVWLEGIRHNCGVVALRNARGALRLVDVRPIDEIDYGDFPTVDASNAREFRWSVLGRETINHITVETHRLRYARNPVQADLNEPDGPNGAFHDTYLSRASVPDRMDHIRVETLEESYEGDTVEDVGERPFTFEAHHVLVPVDRVTLNPAVFHLDAGMLWSEVVDDLMLGHLQLHQDGLQRVTFELGKTVADSTEEGSILILDHDSLKGAHAAERARSGFQPVRVLSLTRHPTHAEVEAIPVLAVDTPTFEPECPEES